jgi:hypothetical protein
MLRFEAHRSTERLALFHQGEIASSRRTDDLERCTQAFDLLANALAGSGLV